MRRMLAMIALAASACGSQPQASANETAPAVPSVLEAPSSKPASVVPIPADQAELDRMILAGYSPHGKHLHAPGVNECPLAKDKEAVM